MVISKVGGAKVGSRSTNKKGKYRLRSTVGPGRYRAVAKRKARVINQRTGKKLICKSDEAFVRVS